MTWYVVRTPCLNLFLTASHTISSSFANVGQLHSSTGKRLSWDLYVNARIFAVNDRLWWGQTCRLTQSFRVTALTPAVSSS